MKELPHGVDKFSDIINQNCVYVDKTQIIYNLFKVNRPYFLSRPRRFGKTLLVDTLVNILRGHRELFKGFWLDSSDFNWHPYPVIRLSFGSIATDSVVDLNNALIRDVKAVAKSEKLVLDGDMPSNVFKSLFDELHNKYGSDVAVLIDEYDAPILSKLHIPKLADEIRETMKTFYTVLKDKSEIRGFTFITGVTRFAKTSIFSSLNNLHDLTLDSNYAALCGFTLEELDSSFQEHLESMLTKLKDDEVLPLGATVADLRQLMLDWYDGYSWDGTTRVLNPWSILYALYNKSFDDYWSQTGGIPKFLVKQVQSGLVDFKAFKAEETITENLNIIELGEQLNPISVLFQSGYLTVDKVDKTGGSREFFLRIPNLEVRAGIVPMLLSLKPIKTPLKAKKKAENMLESLIKLDAAGFQDAFGGFLSLLAHSIHEVPKPSQKAKEAKKALEALKAIEPQNALEAKKLRKTKKALEAAAAIAISERYGHSLFQAAMLLAEAEVKTEISVGDGVFDAYYQAPDGTVFVFEIKYCPLPLPRDLKEAEQDLVKMRKRAEEAMRQIENRNYTKPYRGLGHDVYKVALVIGRRTEVLAVFKKEELN